MKNRTRWSRKGLQKKVVCGKLGINEKGCGPIVPNKKREKMHDGDERVLGFGCMCYENTEYGCTSIVDNLASDNSIMIHPEKEQPADIGHQQAFVKDYLPKVLRWGKQRCKDTCMMGP